MSVFTNALSASTTCNAKIELGGALSSLFRRRVDVKFDSMTDDAAGSCQVLRWAAVFRAVSKVVLLRDLAPQLDNPVVTGSGIVRYEGVTPRRLVDVVVTSALQSVGWKSPGCHLPCR